MQSLNFNNHFSKLCEEIGGKKAINQCSYLQASTVAFPRTMTMPLTLNVNRTLNCLNFQTLPCCVYYKS